ncbi:MAG: ATP-binding cassette domain-containing protein [Neptuniibacter sp.]
MIEFLVNGRSFGSKQVLASIEVTLEPGRSLCIVGPSGCGKTTLLNALSGLEGGDKAVLWKNGTPEIGYLFQQPRLLPWRTLKQNLMLVEADESKVLSMLDAVNLEEYVDYFPTRISLGMARRASLARCLLLNPDLVLMDEPLVSLDSPTAQQMRQLIQKLICEDPQKNLIYVTHDLEEALEIGDQIIVLGNSPSEIVFSADASDLSKEMLESELRNQLGL